MKNKPVLEKCLAFMSCFNPAIKTFDDFRNWVIANHKKPTPNIFNASTGWEYQVPVYTKEVLKYIRVTDSENDSLVNSVETTDNKLKLVHGFICFGEWGNNSYQTYINKEGVTKTNKQEIYRKTVGVKFYFCTERENNFNESDRLCDPKLTKIVLSLRVDDKNELDCFVVRIQTNIYSHRDGTTGDTSSFMYTPEKGWQFTPFWCNYVVAKDKKIEKQIHQEILISLIKELSE